MTHGTPLCEQLTCFGPSFTAVYNISFDILSRNYYALRLNSAFRFSNYSAFLLKIHPSGFLIIWPFEFGLMDQFGKFSQLAKLQFWSQFNMKSSKFCYKLANLATLKYTTRTQIFGQILVTLQDSGTLDRIHVGVYEPIM